jgi:hypothetical protein
VGCTINELCSAGDCVGVPSAALCNDGNVCTTDSCDSVADCQNTPNTASCSDSNACTTGDTCSAGSCQGGAAPNCNDGNICTNDSCNPSTGCVHTNNGAPCNDFNACTTNDTCSGGGCAGGPPPDCNDGNICTNDSCLVASGCAHSNNVLSCNDGNACTTNDTCSAGNCQGGAAPNCSDGNPCTDDICNTSTGCANVNDDTNTCSNGNPSDDPDACSMGVCLGVGGCQGDDANCDDANLCTNDICLASGACQHVANTVGCDDGDACTTGDACSSGACVGGPPTNCDDTDICTDDSCNPGSGCQNVMNTVPCDDGNACTQSDRCDLGSCVGSSPVICTALDQCHVAGVCDTVTGICSDPEAPDGTTCDDGLACSVMDQCASAVCVGVTPDCDDGNPCTTDGCSDVSGCVNLTEPSSACLIARKAVVLIKNDDDDTRDRLKWKWQRGHALDYAEFGDPATTTSYSLCIYDRSGGSSSVAAVLTVDPSAAWQGREPKYWKYRDATASADGVQKLDLRPGGEGKSKASVTAKGASLPTPAPVGTEFFAVDPEVVIQIHSSTGMCLTSEFTSALKNTDRQFKAKSP